MKIRKWKESKKKQPVYFRMIQEENSVRIILCDSSGNQIEQGRVLTISSNGIHLYNNINPDLGLPLDENGQFRILP